MKKQAIPALMLFSVFLPAAAALATTTVTVDDNKVTVDQNAAQTTVVQPPAVVVQPVPVVVTENDPRKIEGEIIRVDTPASQIVIQDIDSRERRVDLKQGMIGSYKVGDYVQVYLMADLKEAKTIHTVRTADVEGDVIATDYTRGQIIVHEPSGMDRVVLVGPAMNNKYQVRDHVKLYVVAEQPDVKEVRLIRVK